MTSNISNIKIGSLAINEWSNNDMVGLWGIWLLIDFSLLGYIN